jgi:hypothetical protein
MPYEFEKGKIYRMPTHFGPAPGPRAIPAELPSDPSRSPRRTLVSASFLTDPQRLERHIPPRFSLCGGPLVTVEFHYLSDVDWLAGHGYTMVHVWWPVTFDGEEGRVTGRFLAVMWENLAEPIITGRCEIGQPKLFADVPPLATYGGSYNCSASWKGFQFISVNVRESADAPPRDTSVGLDGTLMLKYSPRTGEWGEHDICQVSFTPKVNPGLVVESKKHASGTVSFNRANWSELPTMCHVVNALADLPQLAAGPAYVSASRGGKAYLDQRILT